MPRASTARIVIATYNVHRCIGMDFRHDPARVAAVIGELGADAVALQEVASAAGLEGGIDQFEYLADAAGMVAIAGPTLRDHRGEYGNALLTRLPVVATNRIDLSVPGREPRGAIDVELDAHGHSLRLISTHLGLRPGERRKQVARLLRLVDSAQAATNLVLLGDLNEWIPFRHALRPVFGQFGCPPRILTFPAPRPLFPLDRICTRLSTGTVAIRAHTTRRARIASDHLPLRAELVLTDDRA